MDELRREIARMHAHLRLRALVGIGALTIVVFAMGGADAVARTAVALATDGWTVATKNASGADTTRLAVTTDVDTAQIKVSAANIELAQQSSLPTNPAEGTLAYDTADSKLKVYNGSWVVPAIPPTRTVVTKSVNESVTSSTTLQDDNELKFSIGANETWVADIWVRAGTSVQGIKFAVSAPSAVSVRYWFIGGTTVIHGGSSFSFVKMADAADTELTNNGVTITSGQRIHVVVTNGSTPTQATLRWAQVTSSTSATYVYAGSRLIATKIQ